MTSSHLYCENTSLPGIFQQKETDPVLVKPDVKYLCPVHKGLLRNPVQTKCGHRLCRECVKVHLNGQKSKLCPVDDDEDMDLVTMDNVLPDPGFLREIKSLLVYCFNKDFGCRNVVKYRDLTDHFSKCTYQPMTCRFSGRGCRERIASWRQSQHEKRCDFQPASCNQCGQEFNLRDLQDHEKNQCPEGIIQCPYKCEKKMKRRELEDHLGICPLKPEECQYKVLGCHFKGDRDAVAAHERDMNGHFEILVAFACDMKMTMKKLPNSDHQVLVHSKERIDKIDNSLKEMAEKSKANHGVARERSTAIEKKTETLKKDQIKLKEEMDLIIQSIKTLNTLLPGLSDKLSNMEVRLAENDLRFQIIETSSFDGTLLWKIRDVGTRRSDALRGRTVSLYSQPFYTGRFGYKMCARVYLNGDGIGKGSHVSLYFVVMKGEYDALLPWPFQLKITLMLLDQSRTKRHLKDEFMPDPSSTSFSRPRRAEMNVASGCPLFVAHSVIDSPRNTFIQDDTLFIKISVDSSQLRSCHG